MISVAVLLGYGVLVGLTGLSGLVSSKNEDESALIGPVFGLLLIVAAVLTWLEISIGGYFGFVLTLCLLSIFGMRYGRTEKFMPSGLMLIVSLGVGGILAAILYLAELYPN